MLLCYPAQERYWKPLEMDGTREGSHKREGILPSEYIMHCGFLCPWLPYLDPALYLCTIQCSQTGLEQTLRSLYSVCLYELTMIQTLLFSGRGMDFFPKTSEASQAMRSWASAALG